MYCCTCSICILINSGIIVVSKLQCFIDWCRHWQMTLLQVLVLVSRMCTILKLYKGLCHTVANAAALLLTCFSLYSRFEVVHYLCCMLCTFYCKIIFSGPEVFVSSSFRPYSCSHISASCSRVLLDNCFILHNGCYKVTSCNIVGVII